MAPPHTPYETIGAVLAVIVAIVALHWLAWRILQFAIKTAVGFGPYMRGSAMWRRSHPFRARLAVRFPRLYRVVQARLDPHVFAGLPMTLMAAAAVYVVALLGGLVEDVLEEEAIVRIDNAVNGALARYRIEPLVRVFVWITALGAGPGLAAAALIATGFLWAHHRAGFILPLWVTFVGSQATTYIGKYALARVRPEFVLEVTAQTPSFPSGHATGAMAVYGFLAYAIARDLPRLRDRFEVGYWTGILILLVGFSRMFLSVHYFSDVLSGVLVGGFWLLVGFALAEFARAGRAQAPPETPRPPAEGRRRQG